MFSLITFRSYRSIELLKANSLLYFKGINYKNCLRPTTFDMLPLLI